MNLLPFSFILLFASVNYFATYLVDYHTATQIGLAVAVTGWCAETPRHRINHRLALFFLALHSWIVVITDSWLDLPQWAFVLESGLCFSLACWYYFRPRRILESHDRAEIAALPKKIQGIGGHFMALFGGADAGISVVAGDFVYYYKGRLLKRPYKGEPVHRLGVSATQEIIGKIDNMLGEPWNWRNNCKTLVYRYR